MPELPFFFRQLLDHTRQGHLVWKEAGPHRFQDTSGGDADLFIRSRDGDGAPPYVIEIGSEGAPASESTGDTEDPAYNDAFREIYLLAKESALGGPPPV